MKLDFESDYSIVPVEHTVQDDYGRSVVTFALTTALIAGVITIFTGLNTAIRSTQINTCVGYCPNTTFNETK